MINKGIDISLCGLLLLLLLSGCSNDVEITEVTQQTICFENAEVASRALVESEEDMDAFAVWCTVTNGSDLSTPFNGTKVYKKTDGWDYDNHQYWYEGTFQFHAFYPYDATYNKVTSAATGSVTLKDYNAKENDGVDLMSAQYSYTHSVTSAITPEPVSFSFNHLLACIEIAGMSEPIKDDDGNIISHTTTSVQGVALSNMVEQNTYTSTDGWSTTSLTYGNSDYAKSQESVSLTSRQYTTILSEILVLPQTFVAEKQSIKVSYVDSDGAVATSIGYLKDTSISQLEAGKKYRFTFAIAPNNYITFGTPTVEQWTETTGGVIVVE